jgi:monovalent cation:H+ antiporter, CPA1 family
LPGTIGLTVVALVVSFFAIGLGDLFPSLNLRLALQDILGVRELPDTLLNGVLCFLLFAGTLQVDLSALWSRKITVFLLATAAVVIATVLFGSGIYSALALTGVGMPFSWALVLGAILAPTDPVAVSAILSRVGLSKQLQAVMAGESLFNDGVAVVLFQAALAYATGKQPTFGSIGLDFLREMGGGVIVGAASGWIAYLAMKRIDEYPLEITISLALASGSYALANALGASGPIAVVLAGLLIGSRGRRKAMSAETRRNLALFWSVIDEILNSLLFLLIGFEMLGLARLGSSTLLVMAFAIPLSLAVRAASIVGTALWLHARNPNRWPAIVILTWGGLRGGVSVALALSTGSSEWKSELLAICYAVVVFSIVVQGLTLQRVVGLTHFKGQVR